MIHLYTPKLTKLTHPLHATNLTVLQFSHPTHTYGSKQMANNLECDAHNTTKLTPFPSLTHSTD